MPGSAGSRVVTVNELLDRGVVLGIECLGRIHLAPRGKRSENSLLTIPPGVC